MRNSTDRVTSNGAQDAPRRFELRKRSHEVTLVREPYVFGDAYANKGTGEAATETC